MFLRQSTIQTIRFGPFLDAGDGVTEETALTITQALRRLSKDGGNMAQSGETGNSTHDEDGWYFDDLTAADTNTVGELILSVQVPATHLPVWMRWWVIEEDIYDALFGASAAGFNPAGRVDVAAWLGTAVTSGTGGPDVNVNAISDDLTAAQNCEAFFDGAGYNGANNVIPTVTNLSNLPSIPANWLTAAGIAASALNGKGDWNIGKSGYALTTADWNVGKTGYSLSVTPPTLSQIVDGVLNEDMTGHQTDGTLGGAIGDPGASGENIWDAVVSGAAGTNVAADIIAIKAVVDGLNDISSANVLTQVNAALDTAISEIAQGIPSATPTLRTAAMLLYMALRNKLDVSTSGTDELQVHNDAGVVICKKVLSDDGSDYSEAEMVSGP